MSLQVDGTTKGHKRLASKTLVSIKKHRDLMGLQSWDIIVNFGPVEKDEDGTQMAMQTVAEPEYYKVTLDIDLDVLHEIDIDMYVRHELLHAMLWLYTRLAEQLAIVKGKPAILKMEERIVTDLERMPLWDILYKAKK